jgi:hypothetical protein
MTVISCELIPDRCAFEIQCQLVAALEIEPLATSFSESRRHLGSFSQQA